MLLRIIDGSTVSVLTPYPGLIRLMRSTMRAVSSGSAILPLRWGLELPSGKGVLGMMPGYLAPAAAAGIKLVSLAQRDPSAATSSHLGLVILFDEIGLVPRAVMCGATVTARRTAAASAAATDALARQNAKTLAILGTGEQARAHLEAVSIVRRFSEVRIWGRNVAAAEALARDCGHIAPSVRVTDSVARAVEGAEVICTLTSAPEPILLGDMIGAGTHVNLVGSSNAQRCEVDSAVVARSRYFVDYRPSAFVQAAELLEAIKSGMVEAGHVAGEIGEVFAGEIGGRRVEDEITVYKSLGVAAQDLATARHVLVEAEAGGHGTLASI